MPNRDYARSKTQKSVNKLLIWIIIFLVLILSALGLWFLTQSSTNQATQAPIQPKNEQRKTELPSRPEEIYSYIRDLETREVPVDKNSKLVKLTKEQEQQILKKQQEEKQKLAQSAQLPATSSDIETVEQQNMAKLTTEQVAKEKAITQKSEELKQVELKKQQELTKKAEQEKLKTAQAKIVATAKPASEAPKSAGKYGLQCGAFKSKAQAENMQARLAMAGYNARINSSADWNRVIVGPIGDRSSASAAQSNARSVAECLIIGM